MARKKRSFKELLTTKAKTTPKLEHFEKKSEMPMLVLAVLMLIGILLPRFYQITDQWLLPLEIFDWFIWAVFFTELVIRTKLAPEKIHFLVRNWLDVVIVILPAIRVVRIFRALRILRSLRLLRVFSVAYRRAGSLKALSRRSKIDLVVVTVSILMKPFALGTVVILLSLLAKENLTSPLAQLIASKLIQVTLLIFGTFFAYRIFVKEILIFSIKEAAKRSESNFDLILVPILEKLSPIIIWIATLIIFLQILGVNTSALSVLVGGASFILAFALQEALANIFGGLFLTIETPFKFGDIIKIAELGICEVRQIGVRATELYLIEDNTIVSIPNSDVAGATIVNLSRPLPDLLLRMKLGVAYGTDIKKCRRIAIKVMNTNPYVIGDPQQKLKAMRQAKNRLSGNAKTSSGARQLSWGLRFWKAKGEYEQQYRKFVGLLQVTSEKLREFRADQNIDEAEKQTIRVDADKLKRSFDQVKQTFFKLHAINKQDPALKRHYVGELGRLSLANKVRSATELDKAKVSLADIKNIEPYNLERLIDRYPKKFGFMQTRAQTLFKRLSTIKDADELRLDMYIERFLTWLESDFESFSNTYEYPKAVINDYGDFTVDIKVEYFMLGIDLEKYQRIERVESELREKILTEFDKNGIEMPFPTQELLVKQS